jgi:hypothetical protein
MRRSAGFEIADHIVTYYEGDDCINQVMTELQLTDYIKQETLSERLSEKVPPDVSFSETFKLDSHEVRIGVRKV